MALEIGQAAPGFALKSEHGEMVELESFRGEQNVAVVFYPFAFSGICTGELCEIRDNLAAFDEGGVQVLAVSCDPMFALRNWAEAEKYPFPLLSDFWPHGEVARKYGVFNETTGSSVRGTFLIDRDGVLRWSIVNGMGEARSLAGYREAIAAL
ncbi:peroxiredoxin [Kineosporia sp. NBRC 101731]|uniref:peroxiredoxin n=1 Tax=Kineosporia sp. NBRC 101731 TaxID=3032199 RepID=UPI0024A0A9BE|nr:peroxiredoxin [Kineosporia sp. NBRC 101731]GLY32741.1 peroxiredoxin [Kineosporia sp. NBRC 101731]